jgi:hypothetical protein
MKKLLVFTVALLLSAGISFSAESSFEVKVGAFFPYGEGQPQQVSVDAGLAFNYGIDKAFTFGLEVDLNWVDLSNYTYTGATTSVVTKNLFVVPVLLTGRFRFWQLYENYGVLPYIHVGVGYSFGFYVTDQLADKSGGFSWLAMAGVAFKLHESSNVNLFIEVGGKGLHLISWEGNSAPHMVGFIARGGVRFALKGDDF